jgi:hypothetical protein
VGHDDLQVGEARGHRVEQDRVGEAQQQPPPARQAGADAGLAGVEERDDPGLLQRLVQREERLVGRVEALDRRVELESADAVLVDEPPHAVERIGPTRVDRAERDEHVVVARGALGDVGARERGMAQLRLGVDGEHDGGHTPLAVVRGDRVQVGVRPVGAEVLRRRVGEITRQ